MNMNQLRKILGRLELRTRYREGFLRVIEYLVNRNPQDSALGEYVSLAVMPALKDLNDEDFEQLGDLWSIASSSIELSDDTLIDGVRGSLDLALNPSLEFRGMGQVLAHPDIPEEMKRADLAHARTRGATQNGATRSRDDLNALLAVIVTVTAYAANLIERVPSELEKVYAKHPWIPKIQLT